MQDFNVDAEFVNNFLEGSMLDSVSFRSTLGVCVWLNIHLSLLYRNLPEESKRSMLLAMIRFVKNGDQFMDDLLHAMCNTMLTLNDVEDPVLKKFVKDNPKFFAKGKGVVS